MVNEINQWRKYTLEVVTLPKWDPDAEDDQKEGEVGEGGNEVEIEDLPELEQLDVEYAVMTMKGRLHLKFKDFATSTDQGQTLRRLLKGEPEKQLELVLSLDESKNGLDSNFT